MKKLVLIFSFFLGVSSLAAAGATETVVVSPEEVLTRKSAFTCNLLFRKDGSVSVNLRAKEDTEVKDYYFEHFELSVLKKPLSAAEISAQALQGEGVDWHRPGGKRGDRNGNFVLSAEEIPKAYIVAHWISAPGTTAKSPARDFCVSVEALVKAWTESSK
jgi:hypothetical protein